MVALTPPSARPAIIYDATRLMQRRGAMTATGIDRVDLRHAAHVLARGDVDGFLVARVGNDVCVLPDDYAAQLVTRLRAFWLAEGDAPDGAAPGALPQFGEAFRIGSVRARRRLAETAGPRLYLNAGHANLDSLDYLVGLSNRFAPAFAAYVHDLLPIDFPEYVQPADMATHRRRILNIHRFAPHLAVNSEATAARLAAFHRHEGLAPPPMAVLKIGVEPRFRRPPPAAAGDPPRFLMLGTIEPRKNHITMLHLWRRFAETLPPSRIPKLVIAGRRGWRNQAVFDLLDRSAPLRPHVEEIGPVDDDRVLAELARCRALLFPSFGEGWGMPAAEALASGVPVIASDIAALREATQDLAEYLPPEDAAAWAEAILDYAAPDSARRAAQCARIAAYAPAEWRDHLSGLDRLIDDALAAAPPPRQAPPEDARTLIAPPPAPQADPAALIAAKAPAPRPKGLHRLFPKKRDEAAAAIAAADAWRDAGEFHAARACYEAALARAPDRTGVWVQLGHACKETRDFARAHESYLNAQDLDPEDPEIALQIGHLFNLMGRADLAQRHYERCVALAGDDHARQRADALAHITAPLAPTR